MLKKFSVLALAGMLCLPTLASAGGGAADLGRQIDELQRQLEQLKRQMAEMQDTHEEAMEDIDERSVSPKSMMPDGQFEQMKKQELIDLIKYLRTTEQVEMAEGADK